MADTTHSPNRKRDALRLIGEALILLSESDDAPTAHAAPKLIHVTTEALAEYGLSVAPVRAAIEAKELPATLGSRRRLHVDEQRLITWRDSRPIPIRAPRKARGITAENVDPIDQMLARGELRKAGKR